MTTHSSPPHSPTQTKHQPIRHVKKIVAICWAGATNSIISSSTDGEIIKWNSIDLEAMRHSANGSLQSDESTAPAESNTATTMTTAASIPSPSAPVAVFGVPVLKIDTNEGSVGASATSGGANFTNTTLTSIFISEDEKYIFTASMQFLRVFSLLTGECIRNFKTPQGLLSVTVDTNRGLVFAGGLNGRIFSWDYMHGLTFQPFKNFEFSRKAFTGSLANNSDGEGIESINQKRHHSRSIHHLSLYKDYLISCGDDHFIRQWDTYNGHMLSQYSCGMDSPVTRFKVVSASDSPWYSNVLLSHHNPASMLRMPITHNPKDVTILFLQHHHAVSCVACVPREDEDDHDAPDRIFSNVIELITFDHMTSFTIVRHKMIALFNRLTSCVEIYNFNRELLFSQHIQGGVFTHNLMEFHPALGSKSRLDDTSQKKSNSLSLLYVRNQRLEHIECEWKSLSSSNSPSTIANYTEKHIDLVDALCGMGYDRTCVQQCVQIICEKSDMQNKGREPDMNFLMDECIDMLQRDFSSEETTHLETYFRQHNVDDTLHIAIPPQCESMNIAASLVDTENDSKCNDTSPEIAVFRERLNKVRQTKLNSLNSSEMRTLELAHEDIFEQVCKFYAQDNEDVLNSLYGDKWKFVVLISNERQEVSLQQLMDMFVPQMRTLLFKPSRDSNQNYFQKPHENNVELYECAGRCIAHCLLHDVQLPYFEVSETIFKILCEDELYFSDLQYTFADTFRQLCRLISSSKERGMNPITRGLLHFFDTVTQQELKPQGKDLTVDMGNVGEYISLYSKHRLYGHVKESVDAFLIGFHSLIPRQLCTNIGGESIQYALCGLVPEVHTHVLKKQVIYAGVYGLLREKHHIVQWFWKIFETMLSKEERCILYELWSGERFRRMYSTPHGGALAICGNPLSEMDVTFSVSEDEYSVQISPDFEDMEALLDAVKMLVRRED
eukprot:CAMPEP_0117437844 /NCGR_PEP_ID=MMETSP0759-20121206/1740_1 /TAXON_ID=63605 /ORGANISM="Percolomonas cosmopolitus, Strain WS" /LENGTH=949 /DNA_ID=CAMNT_0005229503 /DNA_START=8 /DNA_END=2857 /DNA_ORIENTATION=+